MKIGGMGYAILRVTAEQLRELHRIPTDVVFERTVSARPSAFANDVAMEWCLDQHPFYFRIKHRYLPRVSDRGPLMVFSLEELLKQYAEFVTQEEEMRGEPVPEHMMGPWVDDNA